MIDINFLYKYGIVSNLDYYFAIVLCKTANEKDPIMLISAALTSKAVFDGNICFELDRFAGKHIGLCGFDDNLLKFDSQLSCLLRDSGCTHYGDGMSSQISLDESLSLLTFPEKRQWIKSIKQSRIAGPSIDFPIVYDDEFRLYLAKYYDFQQRIVNNIIQRVDGSLDDVDISVLYESVGRIFSDMEGRNKGELHSQVFCTKDIDSDIFDMGKIDIGADKSDRCQLDKSDVNKRVTIEDGVRAQKKAVMNAVLRRFSIISGGPGTGKTFICEKIIEALNDQAKAASKPSLKVISAASTGKAASKLNMGLTIHRMLGATNTPNRFIYNKDNPIPCDVVIVDEASMIDIALMARLLEAVPKNARLIMLGDKNQLASVEAGAVFGDICRVKKLYGFVTTLNYNFRSGGGSGIDKLAHSLNSGDILNVERILKNMIYDDICFISIDNNSITNDNSYVIESNKASVGGIDNFHTSFNDKSINHGDIKNYGRNDNNDLRAVSYGGQTIYIPGKIVDEIIKNYDPFIYARSPEKAIKKFNMFRILCPHKKGYYGTDFFNTICEQLLYLEKKKKADIKPNSYKVPIMINVNDYRKKLFNGDTGIAMKSAKGAIKAFFINTIQESNEELIENDYDKIMEDKEAGLRSFMLSELPPHENAFAMTVHKSQGSEFDHVLFVIPPKLSPILTRELIYTGVTRARKKITIIGDMSIIKKAIDCSVHRKSGITELIDIGLEDLQF